MHHDVLLTPYERRRWKQLLRQMEADDPRRVDARSLRRVMIVVAAVLVLGAAILAGALGAAAAVVYLCGCLALWALFRLAWRGDSGQDNLRDLI